MTLAWAAKLTLAWWLIYTVAYVGEGLRPRGSAALRTLNYVVELAVIGTLVWAGWWS